MVGADRQAWRIEKAERFFAAAGRAIEAEDWETAISRAYYGLYHAVIALLESHGGVSRRRWDHVQLQIEFRSRFASRGFLFTVGDAETLEALQQARLDADYDRPRFRRRQVVTLVDTARRLCDRLTEEARRA